MPFISLVKHVPSWMPAATFQLLVGFRVAEGASHRHGQLDVGCGDA